MRTTIDINDNLLHQAKMLAAERGVKLADVVNDSLFQAVSNSSQKPKKAKPYKVDAYHGKGGVIPGIDFSDSKELWDFLDEGLDITKLR